MTATINNIPSLILAFLLIYVLLISIWDNFPFFKLRKLEKEVKRLYKNAQDNIKNLHEEYKSSSTRDEEKLELNELQEELNEVYAAYLNLREKTEHDQFDNRFALAQNWYDYVKAIEAQSDRALWREKEYKWGISTHIREGITENEQDNFRNVLNKDILALQRKEIHRFFKSLLEGDNFEEHRKKLKEITSSII